MNNTEPYKTEVIKPSKVQNFMYRILTGIGVIGLSMLAIAMLYASIVGVLYALIFHPFISCSILGLWMAYFAGGD